MKTNHLWHLFLNAATQYPNDLALIAGGEQFTYQELLNNVFHYAAYLHQLGVKPGDRIGILLPRNHQLMTALLGVLACGACYVPLEYRYPKSRNQAILSDSACRFLITDSKDLYQDVLCIE